MMRQTRARLVGAAVFAGLAFMSRASVGMGPLIALGLVFGGRLLRGAHRGWTERRRARDGAATEATDPGAPPAPARGLLSHLDWLAGSDDGRTWILPLLFAVLIPAAVYGYVNVARFGTPFSVPWTRQVLALINPRHEAILAANGGTYFGLKFAPTTLLQYLRPDALAFRPALPLDHVPALPHADHRQREVRHPGSVDERGCVDAGARPARRLRARRRRAAPLRPHRDAAWLRVPLLGALGGIGLTVAISYVAERYLGDWVPLLVLGALIGIQALLRRGEEASHRRATRLWIVVAAVLAVFGIWVNGGLAVLYARLYSPEHDTDRLAMLEVQHSLDVGGPYAVGRSDVLPAVPSRSGTTWIVGDCDSMYWSDGRTWYPVQGTTAGGWFRLRVRSSTVTPDWKAIVTDGTPGAGVAVGIKHARPGDRTAAVGLGFFSADGSFVWPKHPAHVPLRAGANRVNVLLDHALPYVRVTVNGTNGVLARGTSVGVIPPGPFHVAPGVRQLPDSVGLCRELIGHR